MRATKTSCPNCKAELYYSARSLRSSITKELTCPDCMEMFTPKPVKKGRSDGQRRSRDQENMAAKRFKARVQAGSGSSSRAKGDIRDAGVLRGECKETTKRSRALKLDELLKLEKEASAGELPLMEISFTGVYPPKNYVVIPSDWFQSMRDEIEQLKKGE